VAVVILVLLAIVLFAIMLLGIAFVGSAEVLLPYTVLSASFALLLAFGLVIATKYSERISRLGKPRYSLLSVMLMTIGIGYLGVWLVPPNEQEIAGLPSLSIIFGWSSNQMFDLTVWLPIHLVIAGFLAGAVGSGILRMSKFDERSP